MATRKHTSRQSDKQSGPRSEPQSERQSGRRSAARQPLSVERVVVAAMAIADAEGTSAVTMRSVADALGVQAMSLYHHVANKDAILDRMVDAVFARVEVQAQLPWKESLAARARSVRAVLRAHPWAIGLLESRRAPGATTLQHHDAWIGVLRRAGFSVVMVAHALAAVDAYVYGFALQETTLPAGVESSGGVGPDEGLPELATEILASMPADALPNLAWFTAEHVMKPGYSFSAEFEFGLGLVLDGLERAHAAEAAAREGATKRRR